MKSSIAMYQALKSIDVSDERASAVVDALEADMTTHLATKADLKALEISTKADLRELELRLTHHLTLRLGAICVTTAGLALATARLIF